MIDTTNRFLVSGQGASGRCIHILCPPLGLITEEEALNLVVYLVAISGGMEAFKPVYEAICNV